ncbi:MAG: TonB-dependent receptor, partial [Candidatus Aminicenantes bacterium]|nr:TonB-dependent receptor [Candidatus Aminicenantes bacterium]
MRKDLRFLFVLVAGIALVSGALLAQSRERGVIQGKVTDSEGLALPGVTVTASSLSLMGTRTTITDQEGKYRFPVLVGGIYIIEASVEGFASMKKTEVELHVGMTVTVDFALTPAKIETEITVVGAAPLVDITDAST